MFTQLNERLTNMKELQRKSEKLQKQLAAYKQELEEKEVFLKEYKSKVEQEQKDVEKLTGLSLSNLLLSIIGTKDNRLNKEKQELVAAQLKYEEACRASDEINRSIKEIQNKLEQIPNVEEEYRQILVEKELLIKNQDSSLTEELYRLSEKSADLKAYLNEMDEAIQSGIEVKHSLKIAIDSIESAEGWGIFDMMGGGLISTAIKHAHLDDAKTNIQSVQSKMRRFQKELLDVNLSEENMFVDTTSLLKFADYFFDGLITDWIVQDQINESLQLTKTQFEKINQIIEKLNDQYQETENELSRILKEKLSLIESYT